MKPYIIRDDSTLFTLRAIDGLSIKLEIDSKFYDMEYRDGYYEVELPFNAKNMKYRYHVERDSINHVMSDPWSYLTTYNSEYSVVVNPRDYDPSGFREHKRSHHSDRIIYESHIKDLTYDLDKKGYLGLSENSFVIEHLKRLGITHLHLLPCMDFGSVDECDENSYNWGYDPISYFNLEGSYAEKDLNRIFEFKNMVKFLHQNNISVVMDVVYNHTYLTRNSSFEILFGSNFYREVDGTFSNGSGVGNEINTSNIFAREMIIESLEYFLEEMKVDGFRFDLWALMDKKLTQDIVNRLKYKYSDILLYGEPWDAGYSALDVELKTTWNAQSGKGYAFFDDLFRDLLRGSHFGSSRGLLSYHGVDPTKFKNGLIAKKSKAKEPQEIIHYFSCHDHYILADQLIRTGLSRSELFDSHVLGFASIILSFGIPFIHATTEVMKEAYQIRDRYQGPVEINALKKSDIEKNIELVEMVKKFIELRKERQYFSTFTRDDINNKVRVENIGSLIYIMHVDEKEHFVFNFSTQSYKIDLEVEEIFSTKKYANNTIEARSFSIFKNI